MPSNQEVQYTAVDATASGDTTLVAAVTDGKIQVLGLAIISDASVTAKITDGAAGTNLSGSMPLGANGGYVLSRAKSSNDEAPWMEGTKNKALTLNLSGAANVGVTLVYRIVNVGS